MSFWSDSSPIVKGAVIFGAIGIIVAVMVYAGVGPFGTDADTEELGTTRGIQ